MEMYPAICSVNTATVQIKIQENFAIHVWQNMIEPTHARDLSSAAGDLARVAGIGTSHVRVANCR